jgi:hypothetical protein
MMSEVRAVAEGDPWYIGYMHANSFNRGFPEAVRDFNRAFLALPAVESRLVKDACEDPEVVVREMAGGYLAVAHIGWTAKPGVRIRVNGRQAIDAATGEDIAVRDGHIELNLRACQLRAIRVVES